MSDPSASMSMAGASGSFIRMTAPEPRGPRSPFSRTALLIIVPVAVISLIVAGVLTIFGGDLQPIESSGADGYSRSALGHKGLVELLIRLDIPVLVSRGDSVDKARDGLLVVAEPSAPDEASIQRIRKLAADGRRVLVVLPKWYGQAERGQPWIDDVDLIPTSEVNDVLKALDLSTAVVDRATEPRAWTQGFGTPPSIREPQTLITDGLEPTVASLDNDGNRILVGHGHVTGHDGHDLYVLTDPDVLNNFGLRQPDNARFIVGLLDQLRAGGPIVLDETTHGNASPPGLARVLFRFPLVLATMQILICALLAMWAAAVRFGPRKIAPPPIAPGKDFLIRNTAALLRYGGHHGHALRRYLAVTIRDVRHALHAPEARSAEASTQWLERVRQTRGGAISLVELSAAVESSSDKPQALIELADRVYRWRQDMLHGSRDPS